MNLMQNIDKYRISKGLTRRQLADLAGVSLKRMNDHRKMTAGDVFMMANVLGIKPSKLYDEPVKYRWFSNIRPGAKGRMQVKIMPTKADHEILGLNVIENDGDGYCIITAMEQFGVMFIVDGVDMAIMLPCEVSNHD